MHCALIIIIATAAGMGVSAVWYSPYLFGPLVSKRMHSPFWPNELRFVLGAVTIGSMALTLFWLVNGMGLTTVYEGAYGGGMVCLGLVSMAQFLGYVYADKTLTIWFIDTGCQMSMCMIMGALVALLST